MSKVQRNWDLVRAELNATLKASNLRPRELAALAAIDYYAARRYLLHGVVNRCRSALQVCEHLGIQTVESTNMQIMSPPQIRDLLSLVAEVWDGTSSHAELLSALIRSTGPFKVQDRRQ